MAVQFGRVMLFSLERGYGFLTPEVSGQDLYVLRLNVEWPSGLLRAGDRRRYHIVKTDKGPQLMHVRTVNEDGTDAG